MFRTLRDRLILSQVIPILVILPLMGVALVYTLEKEILIPQLAKNLLNDARMLAEISSVENELWGDPYLFIDMVQRVKLDPAITVMFFSPDGRLLFSSDAIDVQNQGNRYNLQDIDKVQAGQEVALTNYKIYRLNNVRVDVMEPVVDASRSVIGIVRVTYRVASVYETFGEVRTLVIGVMALGLVVSVILGTWLAISISRPIRRVTQAIYNYATDQRREPLPLTGPEELRSQIQAVNFLVEQLHSLEQARRQLLANLVHELGRPLGALRSAIHALSQGASQDAQLLQDLTLGMDMETHSMQRLLDDLANLYDKELGRLELDRQPIVPAEWLPGVLHPWEAAAREKKVDWQANLAPDLRPFSGDPLRLAQIIGNLLNNAIQYTPPGGSVTITASTSAAEFSLSVQDTGPGIASEDHERVFLPFYRGDQGRRIKQGMGLGLSIARDLAIAHGGRLELDSVPGSGSTFTLSIPIAENA
jgi:two-component system, OmpR family, sensor histidine kinase BaeS